MPPSGKPPIFTGARFLHTYRQFDQSATVNHSDIHINANNVGVAQSGMRRSLSPIGDGVPVREYVGGGGGVLRAGAEVTVDGATGENMQDVYIAM